MSPRALFLRVGFLLVGALALLIGLIVALTGDKLRQGHAYETYFRESVQGLEVGAPVKFRGVSLGSVTSIGLVSAEYRATVDDQIMDPTYRLIVVRFKIRPERIGKLPATPVAVEHGLRAKLASQGLTGVNYLELDFLSPDRYPFDPVPWLPRDDYVPSVPSTIAQVQDAAQQLLRKLDAVDFGRIAGNVNGLLEDLRATLRDGDVHRTLSVAHDTVADLKGQLDAARVPALVAQLQKTAAAIETLAQGRETKALLAKTDAAIAALPPLIAELRQATNRAGGSVADAQAELIPILEDTRAAVQSLREASENLRRDPGALLLQGAPPRPARR